ncbi:DUF2970 domain-containing protein [SAR92 clade bacterium H921]|jgi:hypothetical protein|nr:DUF2970 domain-containing protein [SAR92 clade bacterium H921]MDG0971957.1 DUF2970 domain-containing protein [Porticoccaceae bacterium]MDG1446486.1 DUF2970 domain-containing protein [Porticoccaceae bacterium]
MTQEQDPKKPGIGALVRSILAAAIGVQTDKNREQDFNQGNPLAFILGGFVFTFLFIATIATIVGLILSNN